MRLKEAVLSTAKSARIHDLVAGSEWRRRRLLILCYHGVSLHDEHEWNGELYVPPAFLRRRLQLLRERDYTILPLNEGCRRLYAGTLPHRAVSLTFDDGSIDFERRALPLLREFDAPATLYLSTYYTDVRLPVFDTMLSYVLWLGRGSGKDVAALCGAATPLPIGTAEERHQARRALYEFALLEPMSAQAKDHLLAQLSEHLGVDYGTLQTRELLRLLPPASVEALPRDLVDVQLHTHRHRTPRNRALFEREVLDNAERIHALRRTDQPLTHFCYPSGEYYREFVEWLRGLGVEFATTNVPNIASRGSHPLLLPRFVDTTSNSETVFEAWISGFAALLPKRRQHRFDRKRLPLPEPWLARKDGSFPELPAALDPAGRPSSLT